MIFWCPPEVMWLHRSKRTGRQTKFFKVCVYNSGPTGCIVMWKELVLKWTAHFIVGFTGFACMPLKISFNLDLNI
jgi:cyanate permease